MSRWAHTLEGDSTARVDGDRAFVRMRSRLDPAMLEPGELELARNVRLDRGTVTPRKGARRMNEQFTGSSAPLTLSFELGHTVAVDSITRTDTTATVTTVEPHGFETGEKIAIEGADQEEYNGDFFITVTGATTFTYEVTGSPATPATGDMEAANGPVLQEVYTDGVRAAGVYSNPEEDFREYVALATGVQLFLLRQSEALQEVPYPTGETIEADEEASVVDANSELFVFREGKRPLKWDGDAAEMSPVEGGLNESSVSSITRSGDTATATTADPHNFETGDTVRIEGANQEEYNGEHEIVVTGATTFTYEVLGEPTTPATGDISASRDEFVGIPRAPWALWFANRMFVPYRRDEFLVSDIFDPENYDMIGGHFRVNIGTSDYLVGLHPYQEDAVLVFMRKSIHLVSGIRGSLDSARVTEITREVGCLARRSIVTAGRFVFFLSDQGVYSLEIGHELKLRGAMRPLSESIQDVMREVPLDESEGAAGVFWDNRYYLALPSPGSGGRNNQVLVYNVLNEGWESQDTYPEAQWLDWMVLSIWENTRRLFGANLESFIYLLEDIEGVDQVGIPGEGHGADAPIPALARSRVYHGGVAEHLKLWLRLQLEIELPDGTTARVRPITRAPDGEGDWQEVGGPARVRRLFLRRRGTGLQIEIEFPQGRGELLAVAAEGVETGRSMVKY